MRLYRIGIIKKKPPLKAVQTHETRVVYCLVYTWLMFPVAYSKSPVVELIEGYWLFGSERVTVLACWFHVQEFVPEPPEVVVAVKLLPLRVQVPEVTCDCAQDETPLLMPTEL